MPTNSGGTAARGGKRGTLLLVAVLLVIQFVSWRGTYRLKASSLSREIISNNILIKRQVFEDPVDNILANQNYSVLEEDVLLNNKKEDKKDKKKEKEDKKHNKKEKKRKDKDKKKHSSSSSSHLSSTHTLSSSSKSKVVSTSSTKSGSTTATPHCQPLPTESSPKDVCDHVRKYCPPTGHLNYLEFFYCIGLDEVGNTKIVSAQPTSAPTSQAELRRLTNEELNISRSKKKQHDALTSAQKGLRAVALAIIISWMLFLFSWVGIVASDFFCPNLSTLAARLGLSESTAGVTFLAFGNGSPDVFSTFGAMRTGSGSLAIGELIGAASFIVSVISGSMMLIAPFRVKPYPFMRDVGFFTVAVSMTMAYLMDGKLLFSECLSMIALYILYAATIIIGSWWQERRRQKRLRMANIRSEHSTGEQTYESFSDTEGQTHSVQTERSPMLGPFSAVEYEPDEDPFTQWADQQDAINNGHLTPYSGMSATHSPLLHPIDLPTASSNGGGNTANSRLLRFRAGVLARHSLLGAVEFRDVVRSLQQESSADRSMEIFQSRDPERYLPHPQHSHFHQSPQGEANSRRHLRTKSLTRPHTSRLTLSPNEGIRASLVRSRSTIGSSADAGAMTDVVRPTLEQIGQQSELSSMAAAVDDPWKEHSPSDGCETETMLPPSALPLDQAGNDDEDREAQAATAHAKPVLPRLAIRKATMSTTNQDGISRQDSKKSLDISSVRQRQHFESPFSSKEAFFRAVQRTRRALFPSLRHFREKSWLGIVVGIVTAPAILLLRMTLPVVDDSEEQSLVTGEKKARGGSESGQIRLAGDESPLNAHQRSYSRANEADEEEDDDETVGGRGVIDLSSAPVDDPWNSSIAQQEGADDEGEEANRQRQLHVASALRHLPEEGSPLLNDYNRPSHAQSPMSNLSRNVSHHGKKRALSTTESVNSCHSDDSHISSPTQNLFLIVAQCAFAPPFCVWAITSSARSSHVLAKTIFALFCGLALATVVLFAVMHRRHSGSRTVHPALISASGWARVAAGFFVSILYIMTIVDEVVSILQTLGVVLGLSDAILGLTVFAMGNSLGDLVANITIAKMGHPVMAISACFAGPLLNLLLGIGISGSWLLSRKDNVPGHTNHLSLMRHEKHEQGIYYIDFSPTLTVSGFGLLLILVGTLIMVPMNGFYLSRKIGTTLIVTYIIIMCVNIGVEVYSLHSTLYPI
ncbi:uncharacterized protein FA14DRAFT_38125 [Meira miltonrushii]|uniref:Sodium/calcium exchanger membrane region domain-containing protein n=1 Tax=Meira miltonrushii TaxID=1280837 RepID=A0A316VDK0_9BASI|nr:uncharacterized protein FA14DRAFT_38125 [Meira miltonrushii]PWN35148.1 hypothetical protein FA14DRAFT_38125 [Meira miltonrushii]